MQYTQLGRTGLSVSRLCLGTMNFGNETSEAESFAIMDRALELGIDFFDTADVYGRPRAGGVTEEIIGRWLAQGGRRRERIVLATKVFNPMGNSPLDRGLSARQIELLQERSPTLTEQVTERIQDAQTVQDGLAHRHLPG